MITAIHVERLQALSPAQFNRVCRELAKEWRAKGCPEPDDMPRHMLVEWTALFIEGQRRGRQLTLF